jgi:hypothetical protein
MLRPLEKNKFDRFFYLKIFLLLLSISGSVLGNYYFLNRSSKAQPTILASKSANKKNISSLNEIIDKGKRTINDLKEKGEEIGGQVLSVMEEKATQIATQSAKTVSDFVFDSTVGNLLRQIEKLPREQRERIKEEICR